MASDSSILDRLDANLAADTDGEPQPERYSIIVKAGDDAEAQGRLAAYHIARIQDARFLASVQRSALQLKIGDLKRKIGEAELQLAQVDDWLRSATHHDRATLYDWMQNSPHIQNLRAKSFPCGDGRVGKRTETKGAAVHINLPELLVDLLPDCVDRKLRLADAKKHMTPGGEGTVVITDTGEVLPINIAHSTAETSREVYFVEVGGEKMELAGWADEAAEAGDEGSSDDGDS
jgi:hypothetical protein